MTHSTSLILTPPLQVTEHCRQAQMNTIQSESISVCNIHRRIVLLARMDMTAHCTAGS